MFDIKDRNIFHLCVVFPNSRQLFFFFFLLFLYSLSQLSLCIIIRNLEERFDFHLCSFLVNIQSLTKDCSTSSQMTDSASLRFPAQICGVLAIVSPTVNSRTLFQVVQKFVLLVPRPALSITYCCLKITSAHDSAFC